VDVYRKERRKTVLNTVDQCRAGAGFNEVSAGECQLTYFVDSQLSEQATFSSEVSIKLRKEISVENFWRKSLINPVGWALQNSAKNEATLFMGHIATSFFQAR
jgi:hypothetical protein